VNDDGLPAETGSPVSEDVQQRGIDFLQGLLASGKVDLDRFQKALDALLEVHTQADFAAVVRGLPSPVEFTPPARRRQEPLEISTSMGDVRLEGRWQVSRLTKIDTGMGNVTIDLSQAEFDDWDVKIVIRTAWGQSPSSFPAASRSGRWAGAARSQPLLSRQFRAFPSCGSAPPPTWAQSA
jgi:hypothetical protein